MFGEDIETLLSSVAMVYLHVSWAGINIELMRARSGLSQVDVVQCHPWTLHMDSVL